MKKTANLTQEAREILQPIKQRPNLEPRQDFVNVLHQKILLEKEKKRMIFNYKPLLAICSVILILSIVTLSQIGQNPANEVNKSFLIGDTSQIQLVKTINYGMGEGEIGLYYQGMNETLPVTVTSFDVKDGIAYLLDEAKHQVVIIDLDGKTTSFPIKADKNMTGVLQDILVTERKEIYIVDSLESVVYQYNVDGELIEKYDLSRVDLFFPDSLHEFDNGDIVVGMNQERFVNIKSGLDEEIVPYSFQTINRKESKLMINTAGKKNEIKLFSELGISGRAVETVTDDQIILTQTVTPPVYSLISETHVFALNQQGTILGGVRIPIESFIEKPQRIEHFIKTDGNQLYLLVPQKEHVALYEMTLGEQYDSLIEEQAEEAKIGFDYRTFGEPFPQLEAEINKLFASGEIEYGNEQSLNGVAIDDHGSVVIDFKHFLAPGPASGQVIGLSKALDSATFDKFPEIEQIYFQFDGSFSAWCYWLESTEEPWKRP